MRVPFSLESGEERIKEHIHSIDVCIETYNNLLDVLEGRSRWCKDRHFNPQMLEGLCLKVE